MARKIVDVGASVTSPEEIYKVLRVIRPRNWTNPFFWSVGIGLLVLFLLFGTIPVTGQGKAIFLTRETVVPFQATASGQIREWRVAVGQRVQQGDILALLDQPDVEKEIEQAEEKMRDLLDRNAILDELTRAYNELEAESIGKKRSVLADRIAELRTQLEKSRALAEENARTERAIIDQEERDLQQLRQMNQKRLEEMQANLVRREQLREQKLESEDAVIRARKAVDDQAFLLTSYDLQIFQLRLKRIGAERAELQARDRLEAREDTIVALEQQLADLENREAQIREQEASRLQTQALEVRDLQRRIDQLRANLTEEQEILSEHEGVILELTAAEGKIVNRGNRLGTIDTRKDEPLLAVAYFTLKDGKQIEPGMTIRLTPATVQRERFGSLVARVTEVSQYAVSPEGAAKVVGNSAVARTLTGEGRQIEVFALLERDPSSGSGYEWDLTDGPALEIHSGTIADALVNVKNRPPITFIIPILSEWEGF